MASSGRYHYHLSREISSTNGGDQNAVDSLDRVARFSVIRAGLKLMIALQNHRVRLTGHVLLLLTISALSRPPSPNCSCRCPRYTSRRMAMSKTGVRHVPRFAPTVPKQYAAMAPSSPFQCPDVVDHTDHTVEPVSPWLAAAVPTTASSPSCSSLLPKRASMSDAGVDCGGAISARRGMTLKNTRRRMPR